MNYLETVMQENDKLRELLKDLPTTSTPGVIYQRMPDGTLVAWTPPKSIICKTAFDKLFEDYND